MGEEIAVTGAEGSGNISIGMPSIVEIAGALADAHELPPSAELEELLERLFGLSCRDQEERAFDPERMAERRRLGFALAKSMRKEAAMMLGSLQRLHRNWRAFEQQVQFHPALLETIFNVDTGGPENLFLPPPLGVLQSLFPAPDDDGQAERPAEPLDLALVAADGPCPEGFWEAVDRRLQTVIDLPVRPRLARGPVPNTVVRDALLACRRFWLGAGRRWSMAALKTRDARHQNVTDWLSGRCERFVADALAAGGVKFNLAELHSAWEWVDAAGRRTDRTVGPQLE